MGKGQGHGGGAGEGVGAGTGKGKGKDGGQGFLAAGLCCIIIVVVLLVLAFAGLGIAKIVMGAIYIDDCPIEKHIPIYLIVAGCVPILMSGLSSFKKKDEDGMEDDEKPKCTPFGIIGIIGTLFNFAWLICGSVWVFGNYSDVMDGCPGQTDCCDTSFMKFALAVTIIDWITMGLIFLLVCLVVCGAFCGICCGICCKKDEMV